MYVCSQSSCAHAIGDEGDAKWNRYSGCQVPFGSEPEAADSLQQRNSNPEALASLSSENSKLITMPVATLGNPGANLLALQADSETGAQLSKFFVIFCSYLLVTLWNGLFEWEYVQFSLLSS